ncbi:MAG TPA: BamA/TamA family outer membrane protein [Kofleriaceae bacterium]|nr:BamA/TamA family outer membrane protein [Kofleriaceae bacterium]
MRRVAIAVLITASTMGVAHAQTPYPVPVSPDEPKPYPVPVPPGEAGPHPEPVPPEAPPPDAPPPPPSDQPQQPPPQQPAPNPQPAPQQPAPNQPAKPAPNQPAKPAPNQPAKPAPGTTAQPAPGTTAKPAPGATAQPAPGTTAQPAPGTSANPPQPAPPAAPNQGTNAPAPVPPPEPDPLPESLPSLEDLNGSAKIRKIVVEENTKTTDDTVELIAGIEVGDSWTADMVDVVKTRLVSSGLFKDVECYWTRVPDGVAVHILAKDKHSWVIAPAFYNQPTNVGGGVGFGENNLFGQNQKLLLYGQIATGDTFFIGAWVIPSLGGTRFYGQLDVYLKSARNIEYTAPRSYLIDEGDLRPVRESRMNYLNAGGTLGIELWRGVKIDGRLRAAKVSYKSVKVAEGATIDDIVPGGDPMNVPKPGAEGADVSNEIKLTIDRRANWYGVQTGKKYVFSFEHSLPDLGSDFRYWLASVNVFKAYQVLERHNLVFKGLLSYGHDLPFQQEFTTGGTSMRGWLNNEFRGNFRALANVEYSVPMFTIKGFSVRGLTFFDSAYTTFTRQDEMAAGRDYLPSSEVRGLDGFKNSVGVGTRFYLRQIVLPLLGLDFGYGLEARDYQVYLAIGLTD